jgi:hypothetical protein
METTPEQPSIIAGYFDRMNRDPGSVILLFAPHATVIDNGLHYAGHDEIRGWLTGPASEYTTVTTQLSSEESEAGHVVTTRIEGNFPGGVVCLRHTFGLTSEASIESLVISA